MQEIIKVLIADGSGYVRLIMSDILNAVPGIEVVDTAYDGEDAISKVEQHQPNVMILDLDIPNGERLNHVKPLLRQHNTALIISGKEDEINNTGHLLKSASGFIVKPDNYLLPQLRTIAEELVSKVKEAASAINNIRQPEATEENILKQTYNVLHRRKRKQQIIQAPSHLVVLGASTGGAPAIEYILRQLPEDFTASVLIAQHMPPGFSAKFTKRLNSICALPVEEARAGARIEAGKIIVALPEANMIAKTLMGSKTNLCVDFSYDDYSLYDRPSIDLLMQSCATAYEDRSIGIILSGLGKDGSNGLRAIKIKGGYTIAQDQASSVIFGMAKVAIEEGNIDKVLPLTEIPKYLINYIKLQLSLPF